MYKMMDTMYVYDAKIPAEQGYIDVFLLNNKERLCDEKDINW